MMLPSQSPIPDFCLNRDGDGVKVGVDADKGRRRREDSMVEIQKSSKREKISQAQKFSSTSGDDSADENTKLENLPAFIAGVWTDDNNMQLKATTQFRKLLSIECFQLPIEKVIQAGVVPRFVEFLRRDDFPQLQFEAAWALANMVSGTSDDTKVVVDHGAVPIFVKLLGSSSDVVREMAVLALANVAGDSPNYRDLVLSHGALLPLLAQLNEHAKLFMVTNVTWTLSNLCWSELGEPQPSFDEVKPALPALADLINSNDEQVLTHATTALFHLSDGPNEKIQSVIEAGVCGRLVELLSYPYHSVLIPALRTVGNIVTGDDMQTQCIISHQALPCLRKLLTNDNKNIIKRDTCWTISNITVGNQDQIQAVIDANLIGPLVDLLDYAEFNIQKEAARAVSNAASGGTPEQIKALCDLLICPEPDIMTVCLEGLESILKVGKAEKKSGITGGVNLYVQMIDDDGLQKIVNLQNHGLELYYKAVKILKTYWYEEDYEYTMPPGVWGEEDYLGVWGAEDNLDSMPPSDASQPGFGFGGGDLPVSSGGFCKTNSACDACDCISSADSRNICLHPHQVH